MRVELLQRVREQIERVVDATPETRPKVLDTEATEIAKTVMESQAALDYAKKVSYPNYSQNVEYTTPRSPISTVRSKKDQINSSMPSKRKVNASETVLHNPTVRKGSISGVSISSAGTEPTTLGKLSQISQVFRRRKRNSGVLSETLFSQPSTSQVASFVHGVASNRLSLCPSFPFYFSFHDCCSCSHTVDIVLFSHAH
jgi:protein HOOK3